MVDPRKYAQAAARQAALEGHQQRVASEGPYERAVAAWVARKLGVEPERIANVDFQVQDGFAYSEYTYESAWLALEYWHDGNREEMSFAGYPPGQFIQECVEIMRETP